MSVEQQPRGDEARAHTLPLTPPPALEPARDRTPDTAGRTTSLTRPAPSLRATEPGARTGASVQAAASAASSGQTSRQTPAQAAPTVTPTRPTTPGPGAADTGRRAHDAEPEPAGATPAFAVFTVLVVVAAAVLAGWLCLQPLTLGSVVWHYAVVYLVYILTVILPDRSQRIVTSRLGDLPDILVGMPLLVLGPFPAFAVLAVGLMVVLSRRSRVNAWTTAYNVGQSLLAAGIARWLLVTIAPEAPYRMTVAAAVAIVVATLARELTGELLAVAALALDRGDLTFDTAHSLRRHLTDLVALSVAVAVIELAHHGALGGVLSLFLLAATLTNGEIATREANQRWLAEAVSRSGDRIRGARSLDQVLDRLGEEVALLWQATEWHVHSGGSGSARVLGRRSRSIPLVRGHQIVLSHPPVGVEIAQMEHTTEALVRMADERERVLRFQRRLELQASRDDLTGLGNRTRLWEMLDAALPQASTNNRLAAIYVDIDRFKSVNDTYGHVVGDGLLRLVANRLHTLTRTLETPVRLSGDEFVVIVDHAPDDDRLVEWAESLRRHLSEPYEIEGTVLNASFCVGMAVADHPMDRSALLAATDAAVARAKKTGRGSVVLATDEVVAESRRRLRLETEIRTALTTPEFELHYQPIVDTEAGRVVAVEALIRWFRDGRIFLRPDEFIPQAEENGLITQIGLWVLRQACTQMRDWNERYRADNPLSVSINVSTVHIAQPSFVEDVRSILEETGFPPHLLIIEITETFALLDLDKSIELGAELKAMGVALWLDDFGTGYSSLEYVRQLPVEVVKLDRSFIVDLGSDSTTRIFIESLVALCRSIDRLPMAEGVERPEQRALLAELGCTIQQGYHFARPMAVEELGDYVRRSDESVAPRRSA